MNLPATNRQTIDDSDDRLIDRLVDGELPDTERRELLLRLENEPGGWRRCALAFLETQVWRQALTSMASAAARESPTIPGHPRRRWIWWRSTARLTGLAAGLAAAFVLGWAHHRGLEQMGSSGRFGQQGGPVAIAPVESHSETPVKMAMGHSASTNRVEAPASIDPVVKHFQQQGYAVETEQRIVQMESKDGRRVKLPVHELRIRYVGDRIY